MRHSNTHTHGLSARPHSRSLVHADKAISDETAFDIAVEQFNRDMHAIELKCSTDGNNLDTLFTELKERIQCIKEQCRRMEQILNGDTEAIKKKQAEFWQRTERFFSQSYLMNRARTWPRGYPGDYEIIEKAYNNQTLSEGLGNLLDRYFLTTTLAVGIRHRRLLMQDVLAREMHARKTPRILNIGCGPCREVLELAETVKETGSRFLNVDFDTDALLYSAQRLRQAGLEDQVEFRQYNALRMINPRRTVDEFGHFDVVYTIGLLDYLSDEVLVRMIKSIYSMLLPGGLFVGVFKDCQFYETEDYHWLVDWSGFLQRTAEQSRKLFQQAGVSLNLLDIQRTCDQVMVFYHVQHRADAPNVPNLHGPHDRRQNAPERETDRPLQTTKNIASKNGAAAHGVRDPQLP